LENFESTLPKPASFEGSGTEKPSVILGDEAYLLKTYLLKPFARKDLSCEERAVNCSLSRARRCVACAFVILTAKWRLFSEAIETNANKAERTVRCICSLHDVSTGLERTTHDPSVHQETAHIRGSRHVTTNVSGRTFSRSSKGAIDVRNAFNAHFNGPTAATPSQNQQVYCSESSL